MTATNDASGAHDLATTLRELRRRAGLGGVEAARRAAVSQSKISKLENGRLRADPEDVRILCDVYDVPADERDDLIRLATELKSESQLSRVVLTRGAARLQQQIGQLESRAKLLRSYQPTMVPGLLQTRAYAELVFSDGLADDDAHAAVAARQDRGNILDDDAVQFVLIITEGALRWQASDPHLMTEQLDKIIAISRRANVQLGVIPWTTPVEVFCTHAFHMYDSAAVVIGTEVAAGMLAAPEDVAVYQRLFERLHTVASIGDDARRELLRIRNDYQLLGG
ncbi:helix-turn-helix domain-containing protein [Kribbella catacumbae]|uniref:helix-turn-helix domain-containing protein n=1 Tax=Kribbella catacumbae TaxID=460086 RepID=UPI0003708D00|nr:helix-turn-helix transcriptional regulator [Kribbella catacumbae]